MLKKLLFGCCLVAFVVVGSAIVLYQKVDTYLTQPLQLSAEQQFVTIRQGESLRSVLKSFEAKSWLYPSIAVHLIHRFYPALAKIKVGTYQVKSGEPLHNVLHRFTAGDEYQFTITLIEGSRFQDVLQKLVAEPHLKHEIQSMSEADIAKRLSIDESKLEGLFLAETYHYTAGTSDIEILKRANQKLKSVLQNAWENRQEGLPLRSPYEALTLASIIEKETAIKDERQLIASVFINRLNKRMRLQTDPTVIYGMGSRYDGNIRKKDLITPTPYNTYVIYGLPPTPIAMVGRASIHAALNPEVSDYLYFVASGNGGHVFSKSLAEHNAAVKRYLKQLRIKK
ncbi:putative aminodeoxychorismate lyase [Vibrio ruber DSM 16370]|uniref:Endolytic murein transglycosylase n=1 Tax=Vibrio ruber (strain DSM 16370 / JCM 11486 / BCRC 17186 / CECT 7878 / LMG 23124 / VR1) TaxID=1123498 RepID=A0A1R4LG64_VIBR1|nr:endolytic transglycosylase MltG [Vibrio ruber]SJN55433.1 putative aminodeoxychorismate lyase [Vibrio ruber DSM 16370]